MFHNYADKMVIIPHAYSVTIRFLEGVYLQNYGGVSEFDVSNFIYVIEHSTAYMARRLVDGDTIPCISYIGVALNTPRNQRVNINGVLELDIYPLTPNTEYTIYQNDRNPGRYNNTHSEFETLGTFRTLNIDTAYHCIYDEQETYIPPDLKSEYNIQYVGAGELAFDEQMKNADKIRERLTTFNWSEKAIYTVLASMKCFSGLNPAYRVPAFLATETIVHGGETVQKNCLIRYCKGTYDGRTIIPNWNNLINIIQPDYTYGGGYYVAPWNNRGKGTRVPIHRIGFLGLGFPAGYNSQSPYPLDYNTQYLYYLNENIFPDALWYSGEQQIDYLNYEASNNLNWQFTNVTYPEFKRWTGDLDEAVTLFAEGHRNLITSYLNPDYNKEEKMECIRGWARYFENKYAQRKRHKMPLWEYLRYTV